MKPIKGHAFVAYERSQAWSRLGGFWTVAFASCECGESTRSGINNISAARQWHREHKTALLSVGKDET